MAILKKVDNTAIHIDEHTDDRSDAELHPTHQLSLIHLGLGLDQIRIVVVSPSFVSVDVA